MSLLKIKPQGNNCPVCGECLDIDTLLPGEPMKHDDAITPEPDDVTFCFKCRTVLLFNEALNLVVPDPEELWYIVNDPGFRRFVEQIDVARASKPNMN